MENASKALIIACGTLIGILIISLAVYLIITFSNIEKSYNDRIETNEINKFNANFTKYEGRNDITPHEIATIINFTKDYYKNTGINICVIVSSVTYDPSKQEEDTIKFIKDNNTTYRCNNGDIIYNKNNGMVNKISFHKN